MEFDSNILSGENEKQYIWRMGTAIDSGLDYNWEDIADNINNRFRAGARSITGTSCYRYYTEMKNIYTSDTFGTVNSDTLLIELNKTKNDILKEKQELHDERVAFNREMREVNRAKSFVEQIKDAIDNFEFPEYSYSPNLVKIEGETDMIIHLTDVHFGNETYSPFNVYNEDIVINRLNKYLDNIKSIANTHFVENAHLILGGDLIQGLIHVNSRIEAKEDVVSQIIKVSEYISNFIKVLSEWFNTVNVYSVVGNHGRAVANKDESIRKENFDALVPFICSKELKGIENIKFYDNEIDADIATFTSRGWVIWATHGDKDTPNNIVNNFTNFSRHLKIAPPDICYLGHRHCNGLTTVAGIKVIESGSTMGMDSYCIGRRLCGWPEQTVTIVSDDKPVVALYDITLN